MRFGLLVIGITLLAGVYILSIAPGRAEGTAMMTEMPEGLPHATLAGGCFWCLESEFRGLKGVVYTRVGYAGGTVEHPSYEQVSTGTTGHAEAVEIYYDPQETNYRNLIEHFLTKAHDPTTLNKQWVDEGPQYRSAIFYLDEAQKKTAENAIAELTAHKHFKNPIVTEVRPAGTFWVAEDYHQQYYEKYEEAHGQPHIRVVLKHQKNPAAD